MTISIQWWVQYLQLHKNSHSSSNLLSSVFLGEDAVTNSLPNAFKKKKKVSALLVRASENQWSLTSGRIQVLYKWIETKGLTSKATCKAWGAPHHLPQGPWSTQKRTVVVCSYDSYWKWIIESRIVAACQTYQALLFSPPHDYCSQAALNLPITATLMFSLSHPAIKNTHTQT